MKKSIQSFYKTHIRPAEPKDFAFIRSLAAEFPKFTVPSEYILWFLTRFHPDYCRVLEQDAGDLKAYLLAVPTSDPPNAIAIWQVAAATPNHAFALEYFAAYLRDLAEHTHATSISFTASRDSASMRLIRSLARQFFNCGVEQLSPVPTGQGELEFRLSINLSFGGDGNKSTSEDRSP
jgi:hypothetical protein